jgi:peptidoglycan hydrolase-like protein with peptidoglycan-binding domain
VRHRAVRSRRTYRSGSRYRLARLHLQPERIDQIQRALIQKGYLAGGPTGKWDENTQSAMRRFQQDNGFNVTGLPEAKSLMKLGLGPHPLPPSLSPIPAQASAETAPPSGNNDPTSDRPSAAPPATAATRANDHP